MPSKHDIYSSVTSPVKINEQDDDYCQKSATKSLQPTILNYTNNGLRHADKEYKITDESKIDEETSELNVLQPRPFKNSKKDAGRLSIKSKKESKFIKKMAQPSK